VSKYFVIAGNYQQFQEYQRKGYSDDILLYQNLVYVSSIDVLRGIRNPKGVFIGTWYKREDIGDILMQLRLAGVEYEKINEIMLARQRHLQLT
jgi:hypothetical protein